jgi:hypothetical protein
MGRLAASFALPEEEPVNARAGTDSPLTSAAAGVDHERSGLNAVDKADPQASRRFGVLTGGRPCLLPPGQPADGSCSSSILPHEVVTGRGRVNLRPGSGRIARTDTAESNEHVAFDPEPRRRRPGSAVM